MRLEMNRLGQDWKTQSSCMHTVYRKANWSLPWLNMIYPDGFIRGCTFLQPSHLIFSNSSYFFNPPPWFFYFDLRTLILCYCNARPYFLHLLSNFILFFIFQPGVRSLIFWITHLICFTFFLYFLQPGAFFFDPFM